MQDTKFCGNLHFRDFEVKNGSNVYKINLKGEIANAGSKCQNAAVCQTEPTQDVRSLADVTTVRYYIAG